MFAVAKSLYITISIVYILDLSGVVANLNKLAFRYLYGAKVPYNGWQIPLFSCSKCMTFWVVLIYSFCELGDLLIALFRASLFSYLSEYIGDTLKFAKDMWHYTLDKIMKKTSHNNGEN